MPNYFGFYGYDTILVLGKYSKREVLEINSAKSARIIKKQTRLVSSDINTSCLGRAYTLQLDYRNPTRVLTGIEIYFAASPRAP